jgi:hypothetical protein
MTVVSLALRQPRDPFMPPRQLPARLGIQPQPLRKTRTNAQAARLIVIIGSVAGSGTVTVITLDNAYTYSATLGDGDGINSTHSEFTSPLIPRKTAAWPSAWDG